MLNLTRCIPEDSEVVEDGTGHDKKMPDGMAEFQTIVGYVEEDSCCIGNPASGKPEKTGTRHLGN